MTLGQKQRHFTRLVGLLIEWAYQNGFELTFGDAYRDPRLHGVLGEKLGYGHPSSGHKQRLAVDLNLFIDGQYQSLTEPYRPLGEYWESLGGSWGGRFKKPDGNHFSIEHEGVQ
jgi:hypothetical protein